MARKAISNDRYRLVGTYERLRKSLLERPDDGRLDKALSYWVLPTDRRLPIAFLDRTLRDLLSLPLDELMAHARRRPQENPRLLRPAEAGVEGRHARCAVRPQHRSRQAPQKSPEPIGFDATIVSESLWDSWCETVHRYGMGPEKLGRLAPSLQSLPTVIWHSRLEEYADRSLADIRSLKTHGEKRVNAILEVFCTVHEALATATLQENIDVVVVPRFIPPLTRWLMETVAQPDLPPVDELHQHIVKPMINQIKIDLGDQVAGLAASRLCLDENAPSVKQQAETIGVTRARVYQLLEDCAKVMDVRWPEGRWLLAPLATRFGTSDPETIGLVHGIIDLFYPADKPAIATEGEHGHAAVHS